MRLFLAMEISDAVRKRLGEFISQLDHAARGAKWISPQNIHLTLKFLGHVEEDKAEKISSALKEVAARHTVFDLDLVGTGGFPNASRPRVIWVGGHDQSGTLYRLQADVEATMIALGFPPEDRAFVAHLTLGRIKNPTPNQKLAAALELAASKSFGLTHVEEIHLIESQLRPQGPLYTKIGSWKLGM